MYLAIYLFTPLPPFHHLKPNHRNKADSGANTKLSDIHRCKTKEIGQRWYENQQAQQNQSNGDYQ